jgi:3-hydroxyacyl-CoA dehydrogenase
VGWYIRKRRYLEMPNVKYARIADKICELGRFGQKTGAGFYKYLPGDRTAHPDPLVEDIIVSYSKEVGTPRRAISDDEIVERCLYALVNEGAHILEEGIAMRAVDIDMVYMTGYGLPTYRGGPMFYADTVGLSNVVAAMNKYAQSPYGDPSFWTPAPLLARLAAEGKKFN